MLEYLLQIIEKASGLPIYPYSTDTPASCIVYQWQCLSDHAAASQWRLQVRIICQTLEEVLEVEKAVKLALLMPGDVPKIPGLKSIEHSGGGTLKDYETRTMQGIMYFDIVQKSEVRNER